MKFENGGHSWEPGDHVFIGDGKKQSCFGPRIYEGKKSTLIILSQYYGPIASWVERCTFDAYAARGVATCELIYTRPHKSFTRFERVLYRGLDLTKVIDHTNSSQIKAYFVCTEPPVVL